MKTLALNQTMGKALKTLTLCVMLLLAGTLSAFAQRGERGGGANMEERMKAQVEELVTALALPDEKSELVRGILSEEAKERTTIFSGFQGQDRNARQAMREEMNELTSRTNEKLAAVLSEEEMEKYTKIQAEMRERRRSEFGGRGGRGGGAQPRVN
ncbi:MAG: hypothetical protein AAF564_02420 [Bacteroidota bacterium]